MSHRLAVLLEHRDQGIAAGERLRGLGVVERTVRRWIGAGDLPAEKRSGAFVIDLTRALIGLGVLAGETT